MEKRPDPAVPGAGDRQSFRIWSHAGPFHMGNWHFHPEYELHLVMNARGKRYVGDHVGAFRAEDLVLVGPDLPHNWIGSTEGGRPVAERCLVLQFTDQFINGCMEMFPELRFLRRLLAEAGRGIRFDTIVAGHVKPLMRQLLRASRGRRIGLFVEILDVIAHAAHRSTLAGAGFRTSPPGGRSAAVGPALHHIRHNLTREIREADLARLSGQSVGAFSRSFRSHTGVSVPQYVSARRVGLACQFLSQLDLPVGVICRETGFRNVSSFSRQFSALVGMPPSRFRSLQRAGRSLAVAA